MLNWFWNRYFKYFKIYSYVFNIILMKYINVYIYWLICVSICIYIYITHTQGLGIETKIHTTFWKTNQKRTNCWCASCWLICDLDSTSLWCMERAIVFRVMLAYYHIGWTTSNWSNCWLKRKLSERSSPGTYLDFILKNIKPQVPIPIHCTFKCASLLSCFYQNCLPQVKPQVYFC